MLKENILPIGTIHNVDGMFVRIIKHAFDEKGEFIGYDVSNAYQPNRKQRRMKRNKQHA